jgi:hypothetical protein
VTGSRGSRARPGVPSTAHRFPAPACGPGGDPRAPTTPGVSDRGQRSGRSQVELGEQLGDVCARLGRFDEAADVYAFTLREGVGLPTALQERLVKRQRAAARGRVVGQPPARPRRKARSWTMPQLAEEIGVTADDGATSQVEEVLRTALREATESSAADARDREAGTRILLVDHVLIPRRQLTRAEEVLEPVPSLTRRPDLVGRAAVSRWLPKVLLGDARAATKPLAAALAAGSDPEASSPLRLLSMEQRRRISDVSGELWPAVPPDGVERRVQVWTVRAPASPDQRDRRPPVPTAPPVGPRASHQLQA